MAAYHLSLCLPVQRIAKSLSYFLCIQHSDQPETMARKLNEPFNSFSGLIVWLSLNLARDGDPYPDTQRMLTLRHTQLQITQMS